MNHSSPMQRVVRPVVSLGLAFCLLPTTLAVAEEGLVALYTFQEGSGTTVHDVSGIGTPLDLVIGDADAVDWLPDGGLAFRTGVLAASPGPATKVIQACQQSQAVTIEAWIKPALIGQTGPARTVTISVNPGSRNITLGQQHGSWAVRTRTTEGTGNGLPQIPAIPADAAAPLDPIMFTEPRLMHVVYVRNNATAYDAIYVDGTLAIDRNTLGGDFSNWDANFRLGLGGEMDNTRFWLGEMYRVAIYSRAWTAVEVAERYDELTPKLEIRDFTPARGALFHPAADGIRFRAVALGDNSIAQSNVSLLLNGQDRSGDLQFSGGSTDWQVTFAGLDSDAIYVGEVRVDDDQGRTVRVPLEFETYSLREDGLLVLYTFEDGSGETVRDVSGVGRPLDLRITDPTVTRWLPGGGLALDAPVRIASSSVDLATKIRQPAQKSNALSVEVWLRSANAELEAARIVTISEFRPGFPGTEADNSLRNFSLLQNGGVYQGFLRSTATDDTGRPSLDSTELEVRFPTQLVYTRDPAGSARLYINGVEAANQIVGGDLSNWLDGFRLGLGQELNQVTQAPADHPFRHWLGELYRIAVYHRALTSQEVAQSYQDSWMSLDDQTPPSTPQNLTVQAGAVFARLSWDPSTDDSGRVIYEVERNGVTIGSFVWENTYVDRSAAPNTSYTYRVRALDLSGNASNFSSTAQVTTASLSEVPGLVKADFFTDIPGTLVQDLFLAEKYWLDEPDVTMFLPSFETPENWGDQYGVRVTGWFVPPQTGQYVFFLSSDDQGEFWLNTSASPDFPNLIAEEPEWNTFRNWVGTERRNPDAPENRSDTLPWTMWPTGNTISLTAGQRYYFEAFMKEGTGGDHLSVTYKLAGEPDPANGTPTRMTGDVIMALADPDYVAPRILTEPQGQVVALGDSVTLTVELTAASSSPLAFQWRLAGNPIPGATNATYTIDSFQPEHAGAYTVLASNVAGSVTSATAVIQAVIPDTLELLNPARVDNTFRFELPTETGRSYTVEYRNDLHAGTWLELQTIVGNGTVQAVVDLEPAPTARYYRVRVD
jgi:hypothetical protein